MFLEKMLSNLHKINFHTYFYPKLNKKNNGSYECQRSPFEGIAKPEPLKGNLKGNLKGYWSRRIDEEHRLVYEVTDDAIIVFSARGHYD